MAETTTATTTPAKKHTERDCDESCACCPQCYVARGIDICDRLCEHAEEDDDA